MKKRGKISRTSVTDIIFLMMSNTGMTREQASATLDSILAYLKQHSSEPLAKLTKVVLGVQSDNNKASLN